MIREARKRASLTQAELARRGGVTQSVISAYERGMREPSFGAVDMLLDAMSIELTMTPLRPLDLLRRRRDEIEKVLGAHGLVTVGVFGSVARGEEDDASDIDLLIDVRPGTGLLSVTAAQDELERLLGRPVDLVPRAGLKRDVAAEATRDLVVL